MFSDCSGLTFLHY